MYASWDSVEYASTRLMSSWTMARIAAPSIVIAPIVPTIVSTSGLAVTNTSNIRPTRYTPAATIVAAWISADTGVGPAIASGSHTCSGNWALLPIVPPNSRSAAAVTRTVSWLTPTAWPIAWMFDVVPPAITMHAKIPNMNGTSPIRVVMNALIAAEEFTCSSYQWPINR
jgi:hypothetical protein